MRLISFWIASLSRLERGRLRNRLIRRSRIRYASRNARSICSGVPLTAAESGTPQCAVIGWPGHTGHTSAAALSQTVNTKSIFGAPGFANSSQLLLRKPSVGRRAISTCLSASERTTPEGWLPALCPVKKGLPFPLRIASAMIERAEFPVHRKRTLYRPCIVVICQQKTTERHPQLQHAGAQQGSIVFADFAFVASTNALMNLPSTCDASASISRPFSERNSRASSTW